MVPIVTMIQPVRNQTGPSQTIVTIVTSSRFGDGRADIRW